MLCLKGKETCLGLECRVQSLTLITRPCFKQGPSQTLLLIEAQLSGLTCPNCNTQHNIQVKSHTNRVVFNVNFINFLHENQPNNIEKINLQWLYGFLVFFYPGGSIGLRSESVPWHVVFGLIVFTLAVGNAAIGFLQKLTFLEHLGLAKYGSEALLVNFTAVITILFGAFVILSVLSQSPIEDENNNFTSSSKSISLVP